MKRMPHKTKSQLQKGNHSFVAISQHNYFDFFAQMGLKRMND